MVSSLQITGRNDHLPLVVSSQANMFVFICPGFDICDFCLHSNTVKVKEILFVMLTFKKRGELTL